MRGSTLRKQASDMAMAFALATGAVFSAGTVLVEPAHAQEESPSYSEEFVAAYQPLNEAVSAEGGDISGLKPQLQALVPQAISSDEQMAAGGLIYNCLLYTSPSPRDS